jgi:hypothetical protein
VNAQADAQGFVSTGRHGRDASLQKQMQMYGSSNVEKPEISTGHPLPQQERTMKPTKQHDLSFVEGWGFATFALVASLAWLAYRAGVL